MENLEPEIKQADDVVTRLLSLGIEQAKKQKRKLFRRFLIFVVLGYVITLTVGILIGKFLL